MKSIALRNVTKTFKIEGKELVALDNISFETDAGGFVSIVGPSGCGKSTLLKVVSGLTSPTSGEVYVGDSKVAGVVSEVGMVFQNPALLPWRTVLENVLLPVEMSNQPGSAYKEKASKLLELVGLKDFMKTYPHQLSGGMQHRVSIIRGLILDPPLLLMDEPFSALDAFTREELGLELLHIWGEGDSKQRKSIVFVTHDIAEAILLSDRVIALTPRPGRVKLDLEIDLPRPRQAEMRVSDKFVSYERQVRESLGVFRR